MTVLRREDAYSSVAGPTALAARRIVSSGIPPAVPCPSGAFGTSKNILSMPQLVGVAHPLASPPR